MVERSNISNGAEAVATRDSHKFAFAGLFLFTLLLYLRPNEMFPGIFGSLPLAKVVGISTTLAYIVSRLIKGERLTIWPLELKMVAIILLLGILFIPTSAAPHDSINMLTDPFVKVVIIFVLMINLVTSFNRLLLIMKAVVLCGTLMALLAIKSYMAGELDTEGIRIAGAVGGTFGNPNDMAISFDLMLPLAVGLAMAHNRLQRMLYFACSAIFVAGVVVTFSRGGFLGLVAMGGLLLWKISRRNRIAAVMVVALTIGVFVVAMPGGYGDRLVSIFEAEKDATGSRAARWDLLQRAVSVAASNPIIGVGIGNYHIYSLHEYVAHNSYLEIAAELGVAGLIAYLILIFAPLRSMRRIERRTSERLHHLAHSPPDSQTGITSFYLSVALQAALVAYIVCSFFGSIQYLWYLYYIVGYAVALRGLQNRSQLDSVEERPVTAGVLWQTNRKMPGTVPASQIAEG